MQPQIRVPALTATRYHTSLEGQDAKCNPRGVHTPAEQPMVQDIPGCGQEMSGTWELTPWTALTSCCWSRVSHLPASYPIRFPTDECLDQDLVWL